MSKTHFRKILITEHLGGFDLEDSNGEFNDIIVTIQKAGRESVKDRDGKDKTCLILHFTDKTKPMICNVTNSKTIAKLYGTPHVEDWANKKIQIGTEKVKAFKEMHDALRIRGFLPKSDKKHTCSDCKKDIKSVANATVETIASGTLKTYGVELCMDCAQIRKDNKDAE